MKTTRREFMWVAAAGGAAAGLGMLVPSVLAGEGEAKADKKLRILFLGGTGFLGPHTVRYALSRGHDVTLFNRGKTHPDLFPELERLVGDRYSDLTALKGREWDCVIDTFTYIPRVVRASAELLKDAVKQYVVISSISVYPDYSKVGMDETAPVATVEPAIVEKIQHHRDVLPYYGAMKALCEKTAEEVMPGRVTNIRPGLISGPGDPSDRFTYWPVRVSRGGEVLAPGPGSDFVQFIDVRALGAFIVTCLENRTVGVFNADGPAGKITMQSLLTTCRDVSKSDARFTWADATFLTEHQVQAWSDMPVWVPPENEYIGFGQVSVAKAEAAGLKHWPVATTVQDTLNWFAEQPEERRAKMHAGLTAEREKEVLAAWHARKPKEEDE